MATKDIDLPRLTQSADRGNLINTVITLYGYTVVRQSLIETSSNAELHTFLSIDGELYHVCSPVFKIEDESRSWKLTFEEYSEVKEGLDGMPLEEEVSLGDIRIQSSKVAVTGDPEGSQLRKLCQRGILDEIKGILKDSKSCNVLLNLCDVPYPRPEDLCDKTFSNMLLSFQNVKKVLVVHPKIEAEVCGMETGLEGTWNRYLATDMACLMWKQEDGHFMKFEKKYLKNVVKNGSHEVKRKDQNSLKKEQSSSLKRDKNLTSLKKGEQSTLKKEGNKSLRKAQSMIEQSSLVKAREQTQPTVQEEEKPAVAKKPVQKPVQPVDDRLTKKPDAKTVKPVKPAKPDLLKRRSMIETTKPGAKEGSLKMTRKISRTESRKSVKSEPKSVKGDEKAKKDDDKTKKAEEKAKNGEEKATKNGKPATKGEQKATKNEKQANGVIVHSKTTESDAVAHVHKYAWMTGMYLEFWAHPVFRGICVLPFLFAFYFLSSGSILSIVLIAASVWFKYSSKNPEFEKYTRSGDSRVLGFRRIYEREIEKMRYARDLKRMRSVHTELKEAVLNAYAVNRVSSGDIIGIEDHEELERELELTFKEFVTENDVKNLLYEVHYTSVFLSFTVFLYLMSRIVYMALAKVWRPVRSVPVLAAAILLALALCIVSNFLSVSYVTARLIGLAEIFCLAFGLWLVTDVTGYLVEIRACVDHVTGVIWREVDLERCILKSPNYLVVKLALDCAVILSFFPLVYTSAWILSIFSVSNGTMESVAVYFPPGVIILRLCSRLAFVGELLRLANLVMFTCLASKFYGLHKMRADPLDELLYNLCTYDFGSVTEYIWKPTVKYLNDLN